MKKLLIVVLAISFVLGFSVLTMGALKITGEVQTEWSFTGAEQSSSMELNFEAPISSTVTAYAQIEFESGDVIDGIELTDWEDVGGDPDEFDPDLGDVPSEWELTEERGTQTSLDEAYFKVKTGFGNLFVGMREVALYTNEVLDEGDSCFGDVVGPGIIAWEYAASNGLFVNAEYARYESGEFGYDDSVFEEGGYMIGVGYQAANWMVSYYHVNLTPDGADPGYAFLFEVEPVDWLKIYATFAVLTAEEDSDADCGVIGAQATFGSFEFKLDIDTVENEDGFEPYGWKVEYELTNKVAFEYTQAESKQGDFSQELECKVEW